jgi:SSS family solute:Na+ symporter
LNNFHLSFLDVSIILGMTLFVVFVGFKAAKHSKKTSKGYFLAAGKMPWYLIGAAFVSTSVGSEAIVGSIGATYSGGLGLVNWEWWTLPTYTLTLIFFIPMYLRNRISTVPDFLQNRYGPACANIYTLVMLFAYVFVFLPPIIWGGSITFAALTGWNVYYVIAGIVILTASYTLIGGLTAVMWTDAIQLIFLIGGGVIFFFVALDHIPGGWNAMMEATPDRYHLYYPPSDPVAPFLGLVVASFGVFLFYQSSNQVMIQRILSARSIWDGMMGIIFAGFVNLIRPLVTCLLGLVVFHWLDVMQMGPSLLPNDSDRAFSVALETFAPSGLRGIIMAGLLAAIMAAISSLVNSISTIFSLNIYQGYINKKASDKNLIGVGRLSGGVALILAALVCPYVGTVGLFKYFQIGVTYVATPFISVILMGILWKRTTYKAGVYGLIGGVIIQLVVALILAVLQINLHWLYVGAIAEVFTILLIIVVSLRSEPPQESQIDAYVWKPSWVKQLDDGKRRPWYRQVKFWFALYALAWFFIYWRFW